MPEIDKDIVITIIAGTSLILVLASLIIVFVIAYRRKQQLHAFEKHQLQSQFDQTLLQTQLEIQEQTLKNISEEIHDNIGQALSLAKLNLNTLPPVTDETGQQKIVNSRELVSKAIVDLRDLSRSLNTDYVQDMGLELAIEYELNMIKKTGTHRTELLVKGTSFDINKQKQLILFRIVQEVLNNIIKHAKADKISVLKIYEADKLILTISDDGLGIDPAVLNGDIQMKPGLGIRNMYNRAKLIGADFSINSIAGKGTEVKIVLPKENDDSLDASGK